MKETITTIAPTDTYEHVLWLAKLNRKQIQIVLQLINDLYDDDFWGGVSKYSVRAIFMSYANRIDEIGTAK